MSRTGLDDRQFQTALEQVRAFFASNLSICNSRFRALTGLSYDQAIKFFNKAVEGGVLERCGRASATHYVLKKGKSPRSP